MLLGAMAACVAEAANVRIAAAAQAGVSLPALLARSVMSYMTDNACAERQLPAGGGVVSASFINAEAAAGGIGVVPRWCGVLRVQITVASDVEADTVVRYRSKLRYVDPSTAVFDVLSDREEAQHKAAVARFPRRQGCGEAAAVPPSAS
jgi:hypothetical protein